jgi:hypothetical protein
MKMNRFGLLAVLAVALTLTFAACEEGGVSTAKGKPTDGQAVAETPSSWTTADVNVISTEGSRSIAYGAGKFVAVGQTGAMIWSVDGKVWAAIPASASTFPTACDINAIIYCNGKFIAGGGYGKIAWSEDGLTWTAMTPISRTIKAIAYGNGKIVVGTDYGEIAWSTDGQAWTMIDYGTGEGKSQFPYFYSVDTIVYGGTQGAEKFVAGGWNGNMAWSADGLTWTAIPAGSSHFDTNLLFAIAYGGAQGAEKFVAGGDGGNIAWSADGINWTTIPAGSSPLAGYVNSIAYGNGKFAAVAFNNSGKDYIACSADGINWTAASNSPYDGYEAIAYGNGKFVAGSIYAMMVISD